MRQRTEAAQSGVRSSHAVLQDAAALDISATLGTKDRLNAMLTELLRRNGEVESVVAEASMEAKKITEGISGMVTGIQFQDRTKQRLQHVVDTLSVLETALRELQSETEGAFAEHALVAAPDHAWLERLLGRFTLSEVRSRFVGRLLHGEGDGPAGSPDAAAGEVELF